MTPANKKSKCGKIAAAVRKKAAADVRNTTVTIAGVATTWNTSEATPQERKVTVTAAADGTIPIIVQPAGTALAYLGGLSIRRLPPT